MIYGHQYLQIDSNYSLDKEQTSYDDLLDALRFKSEGLSNRISVCSVKYEVS